MTAPHKPLPDPVKEALQRLRIALMHAYERAGDEDASSTFCPAQVVDMSIAEIGVNYEPLLPATGGEYHELFPAPDGREGARLFESLLHDNARVLNMKTKCAKRYAIVGENDKGMVIVKLNDFDAPGFAAQLMRTAKIVESSERVSEGLKATLPLVKELSPQLQRKNKGKLEVRLCQVVPNAAMKAGDIEVKVIAYLPLAYTSVMTAAGFSHGEKTTTIDNRTLDASTQCHQYVIPLNRLEEFKNVMLKSLLYSDPPGEGQRQGF